MQICNSELIIFMNTGFLPLVHKWFSKLNTSSKREAGNLHGCNSFEEEEMMEGIVGNLAEELTCQNLGLTVHLGEGLVNCR